MVGRGPQCAVQVRTVLMLTLFLFSPRLPLMLPPLLLHSPLRPLLATAGFLQLRLSCVFSPLPWPPPQWRARIAGALVISLCPVLFSSLCEACSVVSASCLGDSCEPALGLGRGTDWYHCWTLTASLLHWQQAQAFRGKGPLMQPM